MIKDLIKYQNLDIKLSKLEKGLKNDDLDTQKEKLTKYGKEKQNKLRELDSEAEKTISNISKTVEISQKGLALSSKLITNDLKDLSIDKLQDLLSRCNTALNGFDVVTTRLKSVNKNIEDTIDEYKKTRNEIIKTRKRLDDISTTDKEHKESKIPEIDSLVEEMKVLESQIPSEEMKKYKDLKSNRVFPVFTELNEKSCNACGTILSTKNIDEIDNKGYTTCETCHRIVVKKELKSKK